jgi:hypothetical protein
MQRPAEANRRHPLEKERKRTNTIKKNITANVNQQDSPIYTRNLKKKEEKRTKDQLSLEGHGNKTDKEPAQHPTSTRK